MKVSYKPLNTEEPENKVERAQEPNLDLIDKAMAGDFAALQEICLKRGSFYPEQLQVLAKNLEYHATIKPKATPKQINNYAYCLHHGLGIAQSKDKAAEYYEFAANKDNTDAMVNLAQLRAEKGLEPAHPYESELLKKAAKKGSMAAMDIIYESYKNIGMVPNPKNQDYEGYQRPQFEFYRQSAHMGHTPSMCKYAEHCGSQFARGWRGANSTKAVKWYEKAASMGNIEAMRMAGVYYSGFRFPCNIVKSRKWLEEAANLNDAGSIDLLFESYLLRSRDYGQAISLLNTHKIDKHKLCNNYYSESKETYFNILSSRISIDVMPQQGDAGIKWRNHILHLLNDCKLPLNALNDSGGKTTIDIIQKYDPQFATHLKNLDISFFSNTIRRQATAFGQVIAKHPGISPTFQFPGGSPGLFLEIGRFLFGNKHEEDKIKVNIFETKVLTTVNTILSAPPIPQEKPAKSIHSLNKSKTTNSNSIPPPPAVSAQANTRLPKTTATISKDDLATKPGKHTKDINELRSFSTQMISKTAFMPTIAKPAQVDGLHEIFVGCTPPIKPKTWAKRQETNSKEDEKTYSPRTSQLWK